MNDDLTTKPTLETLLEMMRDLRDTVNRRFDDVNKRFDDVDKRFEAVNQRLDSVDARLDAVDARFDTMNGRISELDIRLNRMDSWAHKAYSVMTDLRADFIELKVQLKEHLPSPN